MSFYIKSNGDWTSKLYRAFEERINDSSLSNLSVRIRGPFGAPAQHSKSYKRVVLIFGGIGASSFVAITKNLHHKKTTLRCQAARITSVVKKRKDFVYDDEKVHQRVSMTVGKLYELRIDGKPVHKALKEQHAKHVSDTLAISMSSLQSFIRVHSEFKFVSTDSETIDDDKYHAVDLRDESTVADPGHFPQLHRFRAHVLTYLV